MIGVSDGGMCGGHSYSNINSSWLVLIAGTAIEHVPSVCRLRVLSSFTQYYNLPIFPSMLLFSFNVHSDMIIHPSSILFTIILIPFHHKLLPPSPCSSQTYSHTTSHVFVCQTLSISVCSTTFPLDLYSHSCIVTFYHDSSIKHTHIHSFPDAYSIHTHIV